ncbi:hypothetical protein [Arenibacter sp. F20364]|uniref:hypothetical protein n=1 Tax=Arenibacter sp. F20364 TaxID=2926415 RepID=UPI001FF22A6E|nr:hypothetical protein [Arenibacter sp. F20364]MCK0188799.1 hypothetical protein [Arenibacter sp. F20364]
MVIVGFGGTEAQDGYHELWDVYAGAAIGIGSTGFLQNPIKSNQCLLVVLIIGIPIP